MYNLSSAYLSGSERFDDDMSVNRSVMVSAGRPLLLPDPRDPASYLYSTVGVGTGRGVVVLPGPHAAPVIYLVAARHVDTNAYTMLAAAASHAVPILEGSPQVIHHPPLTPSNPLLSPFTPSCLCRFAMYLKVIWHISHMK